MVFFRSFDGFHGFSRVFFPFRTLEADARRRAELRAMAFSSDEEEISQLVGAKRSAKFSQEEEPKMKMVGFLSLGIHPSKKVGTAGVFLEG